MGAKGGADAACGKGAVILESNGGAAILDSKDGAVILDSRDGAVILDSKDGAVILGSKDGADILESKDGAAILDSSEGVGSTSDLRRSLGPLPPVVAAAMAMPTEVKAVAGICRWLPGGSFVEVMTVDGEWVEVAGTVLLALATVVLAGVVAGVGKAFMVNAIGGFRRAVLPPPLAICEDVCCLVEPLAILLGSSSAALTLSFCLLMQESGTVGQHYIDGSCDSRF